MQISPQPHMRKPLIVFIGSAAILAVAVVATVFLINRFRPSDGSLDVFLSWLPGVGMALWFFVLGRYLKNYDELLQNVLLKSLALSAVAGFVLLFTRMVQLDLGLDAGIADPLVISVMALAFIVCALCLRWRYR
ncbi:MAG: hypothetical protein AAF438_02825 [Pseudomonadota bacterium]